MKVTFIVPSYHNFWEPLGIGYIYTYCKNNYVGDVEFLFFHEWFDDSNDIIKGAIESEIVAFTCTTPVYNRCVQYSLIIKIHNPNCHIVFGGWHPSVVRAIENPCIDQIIIGEGEKAFLDVLNGNRDPIIYGTRINFSELGWPDREFIKYDRQVNYCETEFNERIASIQSVRGCKMKCAMCAEKCMTGVYNELANPLRLRSSVDTVNEIEYLENRFKINKFKFVDPTWSVNEEFVIDFCNEKMYRNRLPWDAMVHAGIVTEESLYFMSYANCKTIMVGCESGSQKILNDMHKGLTISKIKKVFEWGRKYGLERRAFFMIGMPNETYSDIQKTIDLIDEIDPDVVGFTILAPYPGTEMYDKVKFKDVNWFLVDEYSNDIWSTKHFSNYELKKIQNDLCERYSDKLPWHQKLYLTQGK